MTTKTKRDLILTGMIAPWVITLIAIFICFSASKNSEKAEKETAFALKAKKNANRQLARYVEQRRDFQRTCDETLKNGITKLAKANEIKVKARLAIDNTTNVLKGFGFNGREIEDFQTKATDDEHLSALISEKSLRHIPGETRPLNGNVIKNLFQNSESKASITMINGLDEDAYIKIVNKKKCVASFYVRAKGRFTFSGITDGNYTIMYSLGFGWDIASHDFKRGRRAVKYDSSLIYSTRVVDTGSTRTTYFDETSLTLHKTAYGNTKTSNIDITEFDNF